jgi:hypothetical protein
MLSWARAEMVNSNEDLVMMLSMDGDCDLVVRDNRIQNIERVVFMYDRCCLQIFFFSGKRRFLQAKHQGQCLQKEGIAFAFVPVFFFLPVL